MSGQDQAPGFDPARTQQNVVKLGIFWPPVVNQEPETLLSLYPKSVDPHGRNVLGRDTDVDQERQWKRGFAIF